ncbi:uncharacterized protein LOC123696051 isoform X1 [Colias croceus]|uniref:uncharacterized protein LOC123696051 isoform X1 n=1 Tax=Colias crocea TaxID=72248 RepID=UPI001E27C9A1|nr:uncharacterized protein LOC123696051 isoform X1 [Colias croceus]
MEQIIKFNLEDIDENKPMFTTSDTKATTTENFGPADTANMMKIEDSPFSALAPPFQSRVGNDLINLIGQPEPNVGDTAPQTSEIDDLLLNHRNSTTTGRTDSLYDDLEQGQHNFFMGNGGNRPDSGSSANSNIFSEGSGTPGRNGEIVDVFDFLIKSLSSANYYVSMLTREQLAVLRSVRPGLLYEFLLEIAKVRSDKFLRRALPNECAFCKNNGENEEYYSSHVLKDWRGRVLCPVLRAFRCPRCGATGDRAHTIKYCPESSDGGIERSGLLSRRRMQSASPLTLGGGNRNMGAPSTPVTSPSPASANLNNNWWTNFGMN